MDGGYNQQKHIQVVVLLSAFLFLLSIYFYSVDNFIVYRGLRGVICFSFLFVLFFYKRSMINWIAGTFLILYGASSIAGIWYETSALANVSMILNLSAFLLLIGALSPKISFKKLNIYFAALSVILVLVNAYLLYIFVEMIRDFALGELHYFLVMIGSMCLVFTGLLSLLYNHKFSSKVSLIFTLFVFVLIFAEVFRAIAYYNFAYENFSEYLSRALLLLGCSLLVHYELTEKKPAEVLGKTVVK
jgi:hypothetical protein